MLITTAEFELLRRLVNGDSQAFDAVYRQYFQAVYRNAFKLTRDAATAEDVLQEVFISLWEKKETINPEQSIGGWLFVLCYNKSVNILRKKLRESAAFKQLEVSVHDNFIDEANYNAQWKLLEDAMAQLSPQKRKVFELCKLQGKTYEETASALQISKYTVKEYLSASTSFLKEYVSQHPQSSVAVNSGFLICISAGF